MISKIFLFLFAFSFIFGGIFFQPSFVASADVFKSQTISDENFSVKMSANARRTVSLMASEQSGTDTTGRPTTYLCFKWRDLESLTFRVTPKTDAKFSSYKLAVTYAKSEGLTQPIGTGTTHTLYEGNTKEIFDFFYYVDSKADNKTNIYSRSGYDFGLYKFEFTYQRMLKEEEVTSCVGNFCVAVLPDTLDEIEIPITNQILYSVSSANKLLNRYNFNLSTKIFDYVNPEHLQWEVVGVDTENLNYCLDVTMQERNEMECGGFQLIYPSALPLENTTGTSFSFDSNNIEGIWNVRLCILDDNGEKLQTYEIKELSTIKVEQESYLWLILLIIGLVILVILLIILIVVLIKKKHEKVW